MSVDEAFNSETVVETKQAQQQMQASQGLQQVGETNSELIGTWVYEDGHSAVQSSTYVAVTLSRIQQRPLADCAKRDWTYQNRR